MRVPGRWVVSLGLSLYATGCLPATSQPLSLGPSLASDLTTVAAERPGSRSTDSARTPEPQRAGNSKKWILIGAGAAVLVVAIILIAGGGSSYNAPEGRLAPIP